MLYVSPSRSSPGRREKINLIFIFTLLSGASKCFIRALKAFMKKCENKNLNFYFNINFLNAQDGKGK